VYDGLLAYITDFNRIRSDSENVPTRHLDLALYKLPATSTQNLRKTQAPPTFQNLSLCRGLCLQSDHEFVHEKNHLHGPRHKI
jgi:hypothetical protein